MVTSQHRIFLSHSSKDHDFCIRLVDDLRKILGDDDAVWYDARGGLQGGDAWWRKIEQELSARNVFIVVLSPSAVASSWVNDEIDIAWRRKNDPDPARRMSIIPVLHYPCKIRPSLENHQIISFLPPKSYRAAFQEILVALGLYTQSAGSQQTVSPPSSRLLTATLEPIEVLRTLTGHTSGILSVALSADGQTLASSGDKTIKLWNVRTGQLLHTLTDHTNWVPSVVFSADGQTLASGSSDQTVKLWNVRTGRLLRTLTGHEKSVSSVAFSPDEQTLASGSADDSFKLWNIQTGQLLDSKANSYWSTSAGPVYGVAFNVDGQMLASVSSDAIKLWNIQTGQLLRKLKTPSTRSVTFSPDGRMLASSDEDETIKLWNVQTGQLLRTLSAHHNFFWSFFESASSHVAFSADGQMLGMGYYDKTIKLWNVRTGQLLRTLSDHTDAVLCVAFSTDGQMLASSSGDKTIKIWGLKE